VNFRLHRNDASQRAIVSDYGFSTNVAVGWRGHPEDVRNSFSRQRKSGLALADPLGRDRMGLLLGVVDSTSITYQS